MVDDLGYNDLGGYFNGSAETPNINRLAQQGMLFTDFHSNGPSCSPTRASLITGRYPQRMGVEVPKRQVFDLPENRDEKTIADYLHEAGYTNGIIGKWHLGRPIAGNPLNFGFDEFVGYFGGDLDYFSKIDRYGEKDWWNNDKLFEEEGYVTDLITKHSIQFMDKNKNNPFFLFVSHLGVHFPWQAKDDSHLWARVGGKKYVSNNPGELSKLGPHSPDEIGVVFPSMIEEVDKSVGAIMNKLTSLGLDQNTITIFISDNGGYTHYNNDVWPVVGSNYPLRGQKGELFEGGHRVPAIVCWPGHVPPLSVSNETILTMDILPTFLDIIDIDFPDSGTNKIDGVSILDHITSNVSLQERTVFWRVGDRKASRMGPWKLINSKMETLLFDLNSDIGEKKDISSLNPEVTSELLSKIMDWEMDLTEKD